MTHSNVCANNAFGYIGWKYYNTIKKKAMEQEFSWFGLIISLSIAFFIVLASAQALNLAYQSIEAAKNHERFLEQKIYYLENVEHTNEQAVGNIYRVARNLQKIA